MEKKGTIHFALLMLLVMIFSVGWYSSTFYKHKTTPAHASVPASLPISLHVTTPDHVTAIYISGWSAGTASSMAHINTLLAGGTLNSVVIDIKDATGRLSYIPQDSALVATGVGTRRIAHLPALIQSLHDKHIYVIGRIAVFQDPYWPIAHPEDALQNSLTGKPWKDSNGLAWLRADSPAVWHYVERIAEDAYAQGFDEINVDYVRFPSDGNLKAIDLSGFGKNKQATITDFFIDLDATLRRHDHIPLSADIFGLTLSAGDDMGIGQKLEAIAAHVDYVCPMIYPSHFWPGSYRFQNPANHPYEIIHAALTYGMQKLKAVHIPVTTLRPWLQDFSLGTAYTPAMVQAQITATHDVGLGSWLMWDARNIYTSSVYK